MTCEHTGFSAVVDVNRLHEGDEKIVSFRCDIRVICTDCKLPFKFICPDVGVLNDRPTVSADAQELRVAITPSDGSLHEKLLPGFTVQRRPQQDSRN